MKVLAGDIGGTHARLALVELAGGIRILAERSLRTQDIRVLEPEIERFLAAQAERPQRGCLGIAGPVRDGVVSGTNLPWTLGEAELSNTLRIELKLINDFAAASYGVTRLREPDFLVLQRGDAEPYGTRALLGAGTGLGEGFLVWQGDHFGVLPSEGGHATFAAESERDRAFFQYLEARYGHVSWERFLSGPGLAACFEFLAAGRPTGLESELGREDRAAVIARHGIARSHPLASEALDWFIEAYGAEAGNLALTLLATGGVYLAGGMARHLAGRLAEGGFIAAFQRKGRMRELLQRIPVRVILNPDVGLFGAAVVAAGSHGA